MLIVVHCKECGRSDIQKDVATVSIELSAHEWCDKCYHSHERKLDLFFCSAFCMVAYIEKNKSAFLENAAKFSTKEKVNG